MAFASQRRLGMLLPMEVILYPAWWRACRCILEQPPRAGMLVEVFLSNRHALSVDRMPYPCNANAESSLVSLILSEAGPMLLSAKI